MPCDAHRYSETVITAKCGESIFTDKGKTVIQEGFKPVQKLYKGEPSKEEKDQALPDIAQGDVFTAKAEIKKGKTSPPKPFTDDTLLSSMENANKAETDAERKGIGTPATRAGILEKLIKSGLTERKGDNFTAAHKGAALITVLPEQAESPLMTAEWEEKLKLVEHGELRRFVPVGDCGYDIFPCKDQ